VAILTNTVVFTRPMVYMAMECIGTINCLGDSWGVLNTETRPTTMLSSVELLAETCATGDCRLEKAVVPRSDGKAVPKTLLRGPFV
jgi:hypothetical protein